MKKSKPHKTPGEKKFPAAREVADDLSGKPNLPTEFLVVGIGASAGGIQALKRFFENVPADSGMAYVVILHLSPDHDSRLAEILQQSALIPVKQVTERVRVAPDHVYVVPPNKHLTMTADGNIEVTPNTSVEDRRAPVDIFFRTLAESHHARAVAVVLSGTGANGSMGIKRIKERGGAAFVQNPREAEFSEMPRNSIATDLIDRILNVAEIPAHIIGYQKNLGTIDIPLQPEARPEEQQHALREIFTQLKLRTGHDFSDYKRATVLRRVEQRINVRQLDGLPAYAAYVRENTDETTALLKNLLISVTNFFRDREAFEFLETDVLPKIFNGKRAGNAVRIWVTGCATGEEAYSLAMLCAERTHGLDDAPQVQIFASDIDEAAIRTAREGFYTLNDAADVSPDRLRRFFTEENDGYRVRHDLREMILFADHNVLKDPPFSRLDAVTCRNMLIYLNRAAQERVMETFHFALEPGGYLLLGNSESVDGAGDLYATVSKEQHVYQSRHLSGRIAYPLTDVSLRAARFDKTSRVRAVAPALLPEEFAPAPLPEESETPARAVVSYADLHLRLLEQYTPSVLVNERHDIVHLSGSAARFLQMKAGEPTPNLLKLIVPELRLELRTALYQAAERQTNVEVKNLKIAASERDETINIYVRPVAHETNPAARGFVLVLFETTRGGGAGENQQAEHSQAEPLVGQLEEELVRAQSQLRHTVEGFAAQAEELKTSNEELQALNEELRSTVEELETSKEELQSVNEELSTVNQELKVKIEEVTQTTSDFSNLINSTDVATVFLDRRFRVHTFTPAATRIFNLIPADFGRPISDITHRLEQNGLMHDAATVLETLQSVEREARTDDERTYLMRVLPYRMQEDRIGGIVATFLDITERKMAEAAVRESERRLRALVENLPGGAVFIVDQDLRYLVAEGEALAAAGFASADLIGRTVGEAMPPELAAEYESLYRETLAGKTFEREHSVHNRTFISRGVPLVNANNDVYAVLAISYDITERQRAEDKVRESETRLRLATEAGEMATWEWNLQTNEVFWNARHFELFGMKPRKNPLEPEAFFSHVHPNDRERVARQLKQAIDDKTVFDTDFHAVLESGETRWMSGYGRIVEESAQGEPSKMSGVMLDITERKRAEQSQRESEIRYRFIVGQSTAGITEFDLDGDHAFVNPGYCETLGYTETELLKMNLRDITHPDDLNQCLELFRDTVETGAPHVNEKRMIRKNGEIVWITDSISRITDVDGNALRVARVAIDITNRRRAEEALAESETRLRLLIESASDHAIFTTTIDGLIDSWNAGAEKVFGWTESEALGRSGTIIFTPEDREKNAPEQEMETALRMGRAPDERFHLRKDGSRFYASGVMTVLRYDGGDVQGFVKIARDMTEQIEAEKALRDKELLQKLVGAQETERKRIARDLHDELGQQLTALRLKLDAAKQLCEGDELRGKVDEIEQLAKNIDHGVDFLAWELRPAALDDLGLVSALENYVKQWSHHSGVTAEFISSTLKKARFEPEVETNLYRIVQEALNNTHKHAGAKSAEVMLERRDGLIVMLVEDNGRGFDPKDKKNRFKGIGLIGMKERAQLIGGTLEIESAPGGGTTIFVRVPASAVKRRRADDK